MSDFVESAKNFVNSAVSRTSWEAQKQMRIRGKQGEIDKLMEQRQQFSNEIVQIALNLYQQGMLSDGQMSRLCASIIELDHDVQNRDAQLQDIKRESYQSEQFAPGPTTNYTPPPVNTPPPFAQRPASPPPGPAAQGAFQQTQACPHCGSPLRPGALYCRACGQKVS